HRGAPGPGPGAAATARGQLDAAGDPAPLRAGHHGAGEHDLGGTRSDEEPEALEEDRGGPRDAAGHQRDAAAPGPAADAALRGAAAPGRAQPRSGLGARGPRRAADAARSGAHGPGP